MSVLSNLYTSITSWLIRHDIDKHVSNPWLHIILIVVGIFVIYVQGLQGEFMNVDDLRTMSDALSRPPRTSFLDYRYVWLSDRFYRPIFIIQGWLLYRLFGLNFASMQLFVIGIHIVSAVIFYFAIKKMSGSSIVGFLTALAYGSSYVIGILVFNWVVDSAPVTNLLFAIAILLLVTPSDKVGWYGALFCTLLLSALSRENGLVLIGGVGFYALYNGYFGDNTYRRMRGVFLACVLAFVTYVSLRVVAVDLPDVSSTTQDSSISLIHIGQIVMSNFVGVFAPLMKTFDMGPAFGNTVFGAVHTLLSIMVVIGLIRSWRTLSHQYRALILFGLALIVIGSLIPFIHFRYRNLNSAYFGWLILLAIFLSQALPKVKHQIMRWGIYGTVVSLIILSGLMIMFRLPHPGLQPTERNARALCNEDVSDELALEVANWNGFDVAPILECRDL